MSEPRNNDIDSKRTSLLMSLELKWCSSNKYQNEVGGGGRGEWVEEHKAG
jgi:hypothetical protein